MRGCADARARNEPLLSALTENWRTTDIGTIEFLLLAACDRHTQQSAVAIDGSKVEAVNSRDRYFTPAKTARRKQQIDENAQSGHSATNP
jgi:hypothetical protein